MIAAAAMGTPSMNVGETRSRADPLGGGRHGNESDLLNLAIKEKRNVVCARRADPLRGSRQLRSGTTTNNQLSQPDRR